MMNINDLTVTVRTILLAAWDPIGIRGEAEAQDEYDDYVPDFVRLLREGAGASTLVEHLLRIETEEMGLQPDPERASRVAQKLRGMAT